MLAALGVRLTRPKAGPAPVRFADDIRVRSALDARRERLSPFWLRMREPSAPVAGEALVVDAEDTFTSMLAHVLRAAGHRTTVRRFDEPGLREAVAAHRGRWCSAPVPATPRTGPIPGCGCCAR